MSIQSEINRIEQNVANTYAVLEALGADMPAEQTSDNLSTTAGSAKAVLYAEQTLTDEQKAQARANIGAAAEGEGGSSGGSAEGAVLYTEQTLTEEQQTQARTNIGAASQADMDSNSESLQMTMFGLGASQAGSLKWDGIIGDRAYVDIGNNMYFVHVSDEVPTVLAEMPLATIGMTIAEAGAMTYGNPMEIVAVIEDGLYVVGDELVLIIPTDNYNLEGIIFPKKGVYSIAINYIAEGIDVSVLYVSSMMVAGYSFAETGGGDASKYFETVTEEGTTETILKTEHLPEALRFCEITTTSDTLTWDGNTDGLVSFDESLFKVSDIVVTQAPFQNGVVVSLSTGESLTFDAETVNEKFDEDGFAYFIYFALVPYDNYVLNSVTFPEAGVYFARGGDIYVASITTPGYTGFSITEVVPMNEKYLPNTVVQNGDTELILASSTEGSTKKFKITVSDDGTLTATEVTE